MPCIDFTWIWLSGKFAESSAPVQVYDHSMFSAARMVLVGPPDCVLGHFDNPPTILFFTYPLGLMPYSIAFAVWLLATLVLYLAAVYAIIPRPVALIAALSPYPVVFNVLCGHNGFLSAGLVGLSLVCLERRPWMSGIFLGLLTYKPQLGMLFPFALVALRNWRALLSAAGASIVFSLAAAIAFSYDTWPSFFSALIYRASSLSETPELAFTDALVSVFSSLQTAGVNAGVAWIVQLIITAVIVAIVCILWARPIPYSLKAAALAAGAVIATPHAHGYDVCVLSIAAAFLVKDGLCRGFLPYERTGTLVCWLGLFLLTGPGPAIICIILLVLVMRRAALHGEAAAPPPPDSIVGIHA
jgi:hypothetical protein